VSEVAAPGPGAGGPPNVAAIPVGGVGSSGGPMIGSAGSETRSKKQLPSLEDIRRQRAEM
jgi:hypothetical protein